MPIRWLGAWSNGANGSEWSWSIRSHGGGKTSVSSLGVWDKCNLPYDALQRGVLSPLQKPTPERGAYGGFRGSLTLSGGRQAGGGPYRIPHFRIDNYMMYTNNIPCGSYRAPGEPQAVFAVESHTDMIARAMGIDPYAFRLQNVVQEGDVSGTGQVFRHVRGEETLRRAAEAAGWDTPKPGPGFGRGTALGQRPERPSA